MSEEIMKSHFSLEGYKINKAQIEITGEQISEEINIGISPKAVIDRINKTFQLTLSSDVHDKNEAFKIMVSAVATFKYEAEDDDPILKSFFNQNAPAILFPYIRAYISTLSSLSGISTILLPTINLTGLTKELEQNTTIAG